MLLAKVNISRKNIETEQRKSKGSRHVSLVKNHSRAYSSDTKYQKMSVVQIALQEKRTLKLYSLFLKSSHYACISANVKES